MISTVFQPRTAPRVRYRRSVLQAREAGGGNMAYGPVGKVRGPGTVILLSIVTLGIYGVVWQYKTFKEMKDHSGAGLGGVVGLLLAIFLSIVNWFEMPAEVGNLYAAEQQ